MLPLDSLSLWCNLMFAIVVTNVCPWNAFFRIPYWIVFPNNLVERTFESTRWPIEPCHLIICAKKLLNTWNKCHGGTFLRYFHLFHFSYLAVVNFNRIMWTGKGSWVLEPFRYQIWLNLIQHTLRLEIECVRFKMTAINFHAVTKLMLKSSLYVY